MIALIRSDAYRVAHSRWIWALAAIVAQSSTQYGARELRRTIRKAVEDPIAEALVDGRLGAAPATVELTAEDGKPVLKL